MSDQEEISTSTIIFEIFYALVDLTSIIGSIMVFVGCWKTRHSLNLGLKLILFLTIFNFFISLQDLLGEALTESNIECQIYSFIKIYASYLSLLWAISMSVIAYMVLRDVRRDLPKIFRNIVIACFTLALLLSLRYSLLFSLLP